MDRTWTVTAMERLLDGLRWLMRSTPSAAPSPSAPLPPPSLRSLPPEVFILILEAVAALRPRAAAAQAMSQCCLVSRDFRHLALPYLHVCLKLRLKHRPRPWDPSGRELSRLASTSSDRLRRVPLFPLPTSSFFGRSTRAEQPLKVELVEFVYEAGAPTAGELTYDSFRDLQSFTALQPDTLAVRIDPLPLKASALFLWLQDSVRELTLAELTSEDLATLADMPHLRSLVVLQSERLQPEATLPPLPLLTRLDLRYKANLFSLLSLTPSLTVLSIFVPARDGWALPFLPHLSTLPSLSVLTCRLEASNLDLALSSPSEEAPSAQPFFLDLEDALAASSTPFPEDLAALRVRLVPMCATNEPHWRDELVASRMVERMGRGRALARLVSIRVLPSEEGEEKERV